MQWGKSIAFSFHYIWPSFQQKLNIVNFAIWFRFRFWCYDDVYDVLLSCYVLLRYVVLCYVMSFCCCYLNVCYLMLCSDFCCSILCSYVVLIYVILCNVVFMLCYVIRCKTILKVCYVLFLMLCCTTLYYVILFDVMWYDMIRHNSDVMLCWQFLFPLCLDVHIIPLV